MARHRRPQGDGHAHRRRVGLPPRRDRPRQGVPGLHEEVRLRHHLAERRGLRQVHDPAGHVQGPDHETGGARIVTTPARIVGEDERWRSGLGDLVSGAVSALFGATVLVYVQGFPRLEDGSPGPALFPGIVGGLFVLFGSVLVGRWIRHRVTRAGTSEEPRGDVTVPSRTAWINAAAVVGSIVFYLLVVDVLGSTLTIGICLFALAWRLGARVWVALVSAVVTATLIYLVFERLLLVPLPDGVLG
ncbi:MAG: hypothetical protein GEV10_27410 [Streptosporangiales bacterium]|nr:hypothetical protein [Streptosporangiales bacterium]